MNDEPEKLTAEGVIWRWDSKRATGIIETISGEHIWFGLNAFIGRNVDDISIGDRVSVDYKIAQQDSHSLRAVKITWK